MVSILQAHHGLGLQDAVDRVGEMCRSTIEAFEENKEKVPWSVYVGLAGLAGKFFC